MSRLAPAAARVAALAALLTTGVAAGTLIGSSSDGSAAAAAVDYTGRVGLSNHLIWESSSVIAAEFQRMKAAGVTWDREDFLWSDIERTRGTFNWSRADQFVNLAKQYGIEVMPIVDYDTSWSNLSAGTFDVAAYANFAAQIVRRYPSIHAIELWNEPFMNYAWGNTRPDPAKYAAIVRAAATAVKAVNPSVKVGAEVDLHNYADGSPYFDDFLRADPTLHTLLDFWAVHPYSGNCSPYATGVDCPSLGQDWRFDRIPKLQQLAASRGASLPIWITEWGYTTATSGVSEATQAKYIAEGITRAVTEWGVERVFAYTGDKDGTNPDDKEAHYGMRHSDGSEKPVWASLRSLLSAPPGPTSTGSTGTTTTSPPTTTGTTTTTPPPPPPPPTTTTTPTTTTQTTTTTSTPPPPPPPPPPPTTTSSPGNGKKKGHSPRTLAIERTSPAPAATPRWFWPWARWRLGRSEFKRFGVASPSRRPEAAPATIPGWAWRRLEVVRRPGVARRTG
jgi:hypothetical protein